MRSRVATLVLLLAAGCAAQPTYAQHVGVAAGTVPAPGRLLPIVAEHRYTITASIRPLLFFWITRDNVGAATLRWRVGGEGRRGFEFLIGSDPARAPRKINRWGYIAEEVGTGDASLLGVMKESDEKTLDEAEARVKAEGGSPQFLYKAIRTEVTGRAGRTGVARVSLPRDPSYRDLESVLATVPLAPPEMRHYTLAPGVKPGYLPTLDEAVKEMVAWYALGQPAGQSPIGRSVRYIFNGTEYDLVLRSSKPLAQARYRGRAFSDLIHAEFLITNRKTGEKTRFEMECPRTGPRAGIPVHGVFRPRWWFEVEIILDPDS